MFLTEQLLTHNQVACICGGFLQLDSQAPPQALSLPNFKEKVGENGMKDLKAWDMDRSLNNYHWRPNWLSIGRLIFF